MRRAGGEPRLLARCPARPARGAESVRSRRAQPGRRHADRHPGHQSRARDRSATRRASTRRPAGTDSTSTTGSGVVRPVDSSRRANAASAAARADRPAHDHTRELRRRLDGDARIGGEQQGPLRPDGAQRRDRLGDRARRPPRGGARPRRRSRGAHPRSRRRRGGARVRADRPARSAAARPVEPRGGCPPARARARPRAGRGPRSAPPRERKRAPGSERRRRRGMRRPSRADASPPTGAVPAADPEASASANAPIDDTMSPSRRERRSGSALGRARRHRGPFKGARGRRCSGRRWISLRKAKNRWILLRVYTRSARRRSRQLPT